MLNISLLNIFISNVKHFLRATRFSHNGNHEAIGTAYQKTNRMQLRSGPDLVYEHFRDLEEILRSREARSTQERAIDS